MIQCLVVGHHHLGAATDLAVMGKLLLFVIFWKREEFLSNFLTYSYEDFSRDSFDDRMISSRGMRGPSPPGRRYAPY